VGVEAAGPARGFVGRQAEIADLSRALDRAAGGDGAVRLVVGEPGMGKTRLADEVTRIASARRFRTAWGRCWEAGGAPPLWPWGEALRELGEEAALSAEGDSEAARFRRFEGVRSALLRASGRAPLLLVLDDLHAADAASLELLLFVARSMRGVRALVLGTARDAEARLAPGVGSLLERVAREGRRLQLPPLRAEAVAELAREVLQRPVSAQVLERVLEATEGNPLFVDELLRLLAQRGSIEGLPMPASVEVVLDGRLALLQEGARETLETASVFGREFDAHLVGRLRADAEPLAEVLAACAAAGLVAPVAGRAHRHAFTHILVREALYQRLSPARRAALHGELSRLLEATPGAPGAEIAHHALLGIRGGGAGRAVALARTAAVAAAAAGSFDSAASLLGRALDALAHDPDAALRCDVAIELAEAEARAGQGAESRATAGRALDLARGLGDGRRLARAALAMGFTTTLGAVNPVLVRALREALAALGEGEPGLRARLGARLASALQPAADPGEPIALALQAVELARGTDGATLLETLYSACSALGDLAPPAQREPLNRECAALADRLGDRVVAQRASARLAIDLVELGALDRADAAIADAERLGRELGLPHYRWRPLLLRSMRALMHGRFAESDRLVEEAEGIAADLDDFDARVTLVLHRIAGALAAGRYARPQMHLERFEELTRSLEYGASFAEILALDAAGRAGDVERLRALAPTARGLERAVQGAVRHDLQALSSIGGVLAAVGSVEGARAVYPLALPLADREPTAGMMSLVYIGPFRAVLGVLAAACGLADAALGHLDAALRRCRELGLRPLEANVLGERAVLLEVMGRAGEARAERERAEALARELGMDHPSRLLESRRALGLPFGDAGAASAPALPPPPDFGLEREGEVWAVRRPGRTFRLRHSRGLEMLAALVAEPGRELHCTELDLPGADARGAGDSGQVLDARAREAYRRRARELEAELQEAEEFHDGGRSARARAELDALADELARGVGLGGRLRRTGSRAERSRVNVQRRLRDAVRRISEQDPELGRHLERSVRTGTFCRYEP
jgi:tetratricopeptide (TPR) repeat protein